MTDIPRRYRAFPFDASKRQKCPPNAVYVGRGVLGWPNTPWANEPFDRSGTPAERLTAQAESVSRYAVRAEARMASDPDWLLPLRGHDLLCWCRMNEPCHAEVLLELANRGWPRRKEGDDGA